MHFHAVIPAWGDRYVHDAVQYVIPSVRAAAEAANVSLKLVIYTDTPFAFARVLIGLDAELRGVGTPGATPQEALQGTLRNIHRWTMAEAPPGSIATLLNADIVVSREFFSFAAQAFSGGGCRAVVGTALRATVGADVPPIGATARELLAWAWRNRHAITEDCVWDRGHTVFPNVLIFDSGGNTVLHSVHLHPFFLLTDARPVRFRGTIDDDLLTNYADGEVCYISAAEVGFAELSPAVFKVGQYGSGGSISPEAVVRFGKNCSWAPAHLRNLQQPIRIQGFGAVDDSPICGIINKLKGN